MVDDSDDSDECSAGGCLRQQAVTKHTHNKQVAANVYVASASLYRAFFKRALTHARSLARAIRRRGRRPPIARHTGDNQDNNNNNKGEGWKINLTLPACRRKERRAQRKETINTSRSKTIRNLYFYHFPPPPLSFYSLAVVNLA